MEHPVLASHPTLADIQAYIAEVVKFRGFEKQTQQDAFVILVEEVGELAKALRKRTGSKMATDSNSIELEHEAADVLWMLICVCNLLDIDLEAAIRSKEEKNKKRTWK